MVNVRRYNDGGYAGRVVCRVSRITGQPNSVYHAEQQGLDTGGGPWVTICETHMTLCNHATLAMAMSHLPTGDWCEACMKEVYGD